MRIKQCHMGDHGRYGSFKDFYSLKDYYDETKPVVFYGLSNNRDIKRWIKHTGFKVYLPASMEEMSGHNGLDHYGAGLTKIKHDNLNVIVYDEAWEYLVKSSGIKNCKKIRFAWRDHRKCKVTPLGDKIYIHFGHYPDNSELANRFFQKDKYVELFGDDLIYPNTFIPYDDLIENYFNRSFIHIVTSLYSTKSETTAQALGLMGRKTLGVWPNLNPSYELLDVVNTDKLIKRVEMEKRKIGTVQSELAEEVCNFFDFSDDWLYTEYWE